MLNSDWQPISTAKESQDPILMWIPAYGVVMGPYSKSANKVPTEEDLKQAFELTGKNYDRPLKDYVASHWMPLPVGPPSTKLQ